MKKTVCQKKRRFYSKDKGGRQGGVSAALRGELTLRAAHTVRTCPVTVIRPTRTRRNRSLRVNGSLFCRSLPPAQTERHRSPLSLCVHSVLT